MKNSRRNQQPQFTPQPEFEQESPSEPFETELDEIETDSEVEEGINAKQAKPAVETVHTTPPLTRAAMFVQGFRHHHSFICGHERGGAGGCRNNVEMWHSPNGTPIIVDAMPGDNSLWVVHETNCPARRV